MHALYALQDTLNHLFYQYINAQDPTLTFGTCHKPLIRLTFQKITHHQ